MLRLVRQGIRDMEETDATDLSADPHALDRILLGFAAVVVFGRAVTNALQNLRRFDRRAFDAWYGPWQQEMRNDPLLRWFYVLRSDILKGVEPQIAILLGASGQNAPVAGAITVPNRLPPDVHRNQRMTDTTVLGVCRLYMAYLEEMFDSFAEVAWAVHDRFVANKQPPIR
jgi:hypothetical protein